MATRVVSKTIITEEDLLRLGAQDQPVEVINGEIVKVPGVGVLHSIIAANVYRILYAFVTQNDLGYVFTDSLIYVLKRDPKGGVQKSRIPDASFIRKGRIPKDFDISRPFPGAPDLAVEVVSPDERAEDTLAKTDDYFEAGAQQAWVLYPERKVVCQYVQGSDVIHIYRGGDPIDTAALFPGLTISPSDFFVLPELGE